MGLYIFFLTIICFFNKNRHITIWGDSRLNPSLRKCIFASFLREIVISPFKMHGKKKLFFWLGSKYFCKCARDCSLLSHTSSDPIYKFLGGL